MVSLDRQDSGLFPGGSRIGAKGPVVQDVRVVGREKAAVSLARVAMVGGRARGMGAGTIVRSGPERQVAGWGNRAGATPGATEMSAARDRRPGRWRRESAARGERADRRRRGGVERRDEQRAPCSAVAPVTRTTSRSRRTTRGTGGAEPGVGRPAAAILDWGVRSGGPCVGAGPGIRRRLLGRRRLSRAEYRGFAAVRRPPRRCVAPDAVPPSGCVCRYGARACAAAPPRTGFGPAPVSFGTGGWRVRAARPCARHRASSAVSNSAASVSVSHTVRHTTIRIPSGPLERAVPISSPCPRPPPRASTGAGSCCTGSESVPLSGVESERGLGKSQRSLACIGRPAPARGRTRVSSSPSVFLAGRGRTPGARARKVRTSTLTGSSRLAAVSFSGMEEQPRSRPAGASRDRDRRPSSGAKDAMDRLQGRRNRGRTGGEQVVGVTRRRFEVPGRLGPSSARAAPSCARTASRSNRPPRRSS